VTATRLQVVATPSGQVLDDASVTVAAANPPPYAAWSNSPPPLPIVEEHPIWRAVLAELAQVFTPENYNAWLATTRAVSQEGETMRITVVDAFHHTWLDRRLRGTIERALAHVAAGVRVTFVIVTAA